MAEFRTRKGPTEYLVVHCSATPAKMDIGREEIARWHRAKGWIDIGYHYVVRRSGQVEIGRPVDAVGAHVEGHNYHSVGICMVGGSNADDINKAEDNFTPEQFEALGALLEGLRMHYPEAKIVGHRDLNPHKACPSFDVAEALRTGRVKLTASHD